MKKIITIIIAVIITLMISLSSFAQLGGYVHLGTETFLKSNVYGSIGVRYKEFKLGYFHQRAHLNGRDNITYQSNGVFGEAGIVSVENIAFFSLGARAMKTNERFIQFKPHATIAFRFTKNLELPIMISTYKKWLTGNVGLRVRF